MKVNRPSLNKRTRGQRILNSVGFSIHGICCGSIFFVVQKYFEPVQFF